LQRLRFWLGFTDSWGQSGVGFTEVLELLAVHKEEATIVYIGSKEIRVFKVTQTGEGVPGRVTSRVG
jgi:hypothetical protein